MLASLGFDSKVLRNYSMQSLGALDRVHGSIPANFALFCIVGCQIVANTPKHGLFCLLFVISFTVFTSRCVFGC